jgi:hypothetical protein
MNFIHSFFGKSSQIANIFKILPMGAELFDADGRMDAQP